MGVSFSESLTFVAEYERGVLEHRPSNADLFTFTDRKWVWVYGEWAGVMRESSSAGGGGVRSYVTQHTDVPSVSLLPTASPLSRPQRSGGRV